MLATRRPEAALEVVELEAGDEAVPELLGEVAEAAEDPADDVGIRVEAVGKTSDVEVDARLQNCCASASADARGAGKVDVADAADEVADAVPFVAVPEALAVELAAVDVAEVAVVHCDISARTQS